MKVVNVEANSSFCATASGEGGEEERQATRAKQLTKPMMISLVRLCVRTEIMKEIMNEGL